MLSLHVQHQKFSGGELNVITPVTTSVEDTVFDLKKRLLSSDEIMKMLLTVDAFKRQGLELDLLEIPYFPYARADRVFRPGNPLGVQVMADLVNSLGAKRVRVWDPHSEAVELLVKKLSGNQSAMDVR